MKSLTALPDDPTYLDRYISIRDKKHKATREPLVAAHTLVETRYNVYAQAIGQRNLVGIKKNAKAIGLRAPLRACYNVATQPLKELKQAIIKAQPKRLLKYCPMCGTTLPGTFDHYMPAVDFPEFAVHPLNLVPCCAKCNSTKDDDWLCAAGKRQFLHAYTDQIPDLQFLAVTLHENRARDAVGAAFSLQRPAGLANEQWDLIDSHFRRLKLIDRYDERGNDEVAEILSDCRTFLDAGGQKVRDFLSKRAEDRITVYGRNHWIAVLMGAMCQHANFEDWVRAQ
ncbi:hypothetical protein [Stutzerimonas nitrititolerans]|uniref:hypothetical protein n=1 Tax=Stutzerimonas nitrititolerans TaxID=2482751 RepID=UPI001BD296E2|nr:hypothetical protein [Stutzerimonas nitrititolerans]